MLWKLLCFVLTERKTIRIMYSKGIHALVSNDTLDWHLDAFDWHFDQCQTDSQSRLEQHLVWLSIYMHSTIGWYSAKCQLANMYWLTLIGCLHSINMHSTVGQCSAKCWLAHMYWLTLDSMSANSSWLSPNCQLRSGSMIVDWVLSKVSIENQLSVNQGSLEGQSTVECEWLGALMIQQ